jgi:hypothetical protein
MVVELAHNPQSCLEIMVAEAVGWKFACFEAIVRGLAAAARMGFVDGCNSAAAAAAAAAAEGSSAVVGIALVVLDSRMDCKN